MGGSPFLENRNSLTLRYSGFATDALESTKRLRNFHRMVSPVTPFNFAASPFQAYSQPRGENPPAARFSAADGFSDALP